jgi:hypothetical protein
MSAILVAHKVFIASPSDVQREREAASNTIQLWNDEHSDNQGTILRPVLWERHSTPELSGPPQTIIERRLLRHADILVAIFWTRLGSSTGRTESGTLEEIEDFCQSGKPTLLYFSRRLVRPQEMNADQWTRLRAMEERYKRLGIVWSFDKVSQFREQLRRHLTDVVGRLSEIAPPHSTSAEGTPA